MTGTQTARPPYTTTTIPLRREHLCETALCDPLFPGKAYSLPLVALGQEALIYDADCWDVWNGRHGIVTGYSFFTGLHTMLVQGIWEVDFYSREIMKIR